MAFLVLGLTVASTQPASAATIIFDGFDATLQGRNSDDTAASPNLGDGAIIGNSYLSAGNTAVVDWYDFSVGTVNARRRTELAPSGGTGSYTVTYDGTNGTFDQGTGAIYDTRLEYDQFSSALDLSGTSFFQIQFPTFDATANGNASVILELTDGGTTIISNAQTLNGVDGTAYNFFFALDATNFPTIGSIDLASIDGVTLEIDALSDAIDLQVDFVSFTDQPNGIPEPSTFALLGCMVVAGGVARRRQAKKA